MAGSRDTTKPRWGRTSRLDLVAAVVLVVSASAVASSGAPGFVAAPLTGLAAVVTVDRVCRRPDRSVLESLVRGAGGLVLVLIALGLFLSALPGGLTAASWAVGAGLAAVVCLAGCVGRPGPPRVRLPSRGRVVAGAAGYAVAATLLGVAFATTVRATDRAERAPLALSLTSSQAGSAHLAISAGTTGGTYDLLISDGQTRPAVQGPFVVAAGDTLEHSVPLAAGERVSISLVASGTTQPLRSLVLQGPAPLPATAGTTSPKPTTPAPTTTSATIPPATTRPPTPAAPVAPTPRTTSVRPPVLGPATPLPTVPVLGVASLLPTQAVQGP